MLGKKIRRREWNITVLSGCRCISLCERDHRNMSTTMLIVTA